MLKAIDKAPGRCRQALIAVLLQWCIAPVDTLWISAAYGQQPQETANQLEPELVEPLTEPLAVIPPGREDLLAEMLGRGATLPGQCTFTAGKIDRETVTTTYACDTGAVSLTLYHPSKAPSDATLTEQFAIAVQSGAPPAGLVEELAARIRSREKDFAWLWLGATASRQPTRFVIIAVLVAGGLLWLAMRRRRQAKAP